jgi:hypothetical protein
MKFDYGGNDLSDYIYGWRADPTNNPRLSTNGISNIPHRLDRSELYESIRGLVEGEKHGGVKLSDQQILNMALHEGRTDLGYNAKPGITKKPKYTNIRDKLIDEGHDSEAASIPALVLEKMDTSKRTGLPFEVLWNGSGKSAVTGKTGADYYHEAKAMEYAASHPKNKPILDFVRKARLNDFNPREHLANNIREFEMSGEPLGGLNYRELHQHLMDNVDSNTARLIKNVDPKLLQRAALNQFRVVNGIEPITPVVTSQIGNVTGLYPVKGRASTVWQNELNTHKIPTEVSEANAIVEHPQVREQLQTLYTPFIKQFNLTPQAPQQDATPTPAPVDIMGNVTNMKKGGYIVKPIKGGLKLI